MILLQFRFLHRDDVQFVGGCKKMEFFQFAADTIYVDLDQFESFSAAWIAAGSARRG